MAPSFLPWHRRFLLEFERALQREAPGVTVPYWDWTAARSPVGSPWTDDLLGGTGRGTERQVATGPFARANGWIVRENITDDDFLVRDLGRPSNPFPLPSQDELALAMRESVYDVEPWNSTVSSGFRNGLEGWTGARTGDGRWRNHNRVHRWVGGTMLGGASVNDPVFWLHHSFVDLLWSRWRKAHPPMVDVALGAVDTVAVVYVMRGAFARHHLLAEARRHLAYALRGRPHQPGLDEQIVQTVVDDYTRPVGRGLMMTADLRALYPRDTEDQAVLRALTRKGSATPYERARLAAGALAARVRALRRADRLNSRPRPHTVTVPTTLSPRLGRRVGRDLEPTTDVAAVELTSRTLEAAVAEMAARLQAGIRERAAARRPSLKPAAAPPPSAQQPVQPVPGRTPPTGGIG
ncbi:tyrosinase family protein [Streptomyces sp. NPDC059578]|uniref:tyrosinase family protein n=1 Tax=Streptomyces sp. NPDC059578 TaxID=3346874 RepID=UPI00369F2CAD